MRVLAIIGAAVGAMVVLGLAGLVWLGSVSPETRVVTGSEVTAKDTKTLRKLGLLEEGEKLRFMYSDGLTELDEGVYLLTDRRLVLHGRDRASPTSALPLTEIAEVQATFSDSWIEDSTVWVTLANGDEHSFPLSMEGGGDQRFVAALKKASGPAPVANE